MNVRIQGEAKTNIEAESSNMLQLSRVPTLRNMGIITEEERYAAMSEQEKAAFRERIVEIMHAENVCYVGCFLAEAMPQNADRDPENKADVSAAQGLGKKARRMTHRVAAVDQSDRE